MDELAKNLQNPNANQDQSSQSNIQSVETKNSNPTINKPSSEFVAPPWKTGKYDKSKFDISQPPPKREEEYASFIKRFLALLVDGIVVGAIGAIIAFLIGKVSDVLLSEYLEFGKNTSSIIGQIPTYVIGPLYYTYFTGSSGQTPGKMALGIKVIKKETGKPIGYISAFVREIVGKMISALILGLGYLWMLWDKEKQCWHDKIAGTIVVNVEKK